MIWGLRKPAELLRALAPKFMPRATRRDVPKEVSREPPPAEGDPSNTARQPDLRELRLPLEVEKALLDAGMPPEGSSIYDGPKRAPDTPAEAARKFVLWARAVGVFGSHSLRTIGALYWECAEVDHREPVAITRFLRALKSASGVRLGASPDDR